MPTSRAMAAVVSPLTPLFPMTLSDARTTCSLRTSPRVFLFNTLFCILCSFYINVSERLLTIKLYQQEHKVVNNFLWLFCDRIDLGDGTGPVRHPEVVSLPSSLFPLPSSLFPLPSSLFPLPSSLFPSPFTFPSNVIPGLTRNPVSLRSEERRVGEEGRSR